MRELRVDCPPADGNVFRKPPVAELHERAKSERLQKHARCRHGWMHTCSVGKLKTCRCLAGRPEDVVGWSMESGRSTDAGGGVVCIHAMHTVRKHGLSQRWHRYGRGIGCIQRSCTHNARKMINARVTVLGADCAGSLGASSASCGPVHRPTGRLLRHVEHQRSRATSLL